MFRRSTNNPWIPVGGLNSGTFGTIGGADAGSLDNRFPGMLGQTVVHSSATALKDSKTSVGTLFEGVYQIVKFASGVTNVTRGQIACWDTLANNGLSQFLVTNVPTAAIPRAGVILFTENSVGGKFAYIQVAGFASMLYGNAAPGPIGSLVIQATAADTPLLTVATVNTFADGTATPAAGGTFQKSLLGMAYETPVQNAVARVLMNTNGWYYNVA